MLYQLFDRDCIVSRRIVCFVLVYVWYCVRYCIFIVGKRKLASSGSIFFLLRGRRCQDLGATFVFTLYLVYDLAWLGGPS